MPSDTIIGRCPQCQGALPLHHSDCPHFTPPITEFVSRQFADIERALNLTDRATDAHTAAYRALAELRAYRPAATDYACPECHHDAVLANRSDTVGICAHCGWFGPVGDQPADPLTDTEREAWARGVARVWVEHWKPRTDHRYGQDFAAFLGERFLTDFDLRDIERAARATTPEGNAACASCHKPLSEHTEPSPYGPADSLACPPPSMTGYYRPAEPPHDE